MQIWRKKGLSAGGSCALAGAVYTLLAVALTYPQITWMRSGLKRGPEGRVHEDALQNVWILAWQAHALRDCPGEFWNTNLYFPRENTLAYCPIVLGYAPIAAPLVWLTRNPVLACNVCVLATFVANALAMFLLVRRLTRSAAAAIVAGFAFAFMPLRFSYYGQLHIPSSQWMVLALWCWHRFCSRQRLSDAWWLLVFCFVQGLFCGYYLVFFCTLLPVLFAAQALASRRLRSRRNLTLALVFLPCLAALLLPFYKPYLAHQQQMGFGRTLDDSTQYSADVLSYASAPTTNRLYGGWLKAGPESETQAFPGVALIALALVGARSCFRCRLTRGRTAFMPYVILGAASFVLSLGPVIQLGGRRICWGPYWLLHRFVPAYASLRVPGRFAMLVMMSLCVLAGYGMRKLLRRRGGRAYRFLSLAALLLLAAECVHVPLPLVTVPLEDDLPPVYRWLRSQPASTSVVELPLDLGPHDYDYLYTSVYHWRKLVNGVSGYYPPENVPKYLTFRRGLASPSCTQLLADLGVDYVIVHGDRMPVRVDKLVLPPGLELHNRFGDDYVYRVTGASQKRKPSGQEWAEIPRADWKIHTNAPSTPTTWAIDGKLDTQWRTEVAPRGGMRLQIDMGRAHEVGKVLFEFGSGGNEFPRYFKLRLSTDGREWETVADEADMPQFWADVYRSALATPENPQLAITFGPQQCRYILVELAPHEGYSGWAWAFAEVRAFGRL